MTTADQHGDTSRSEALTAEICAELPTTPTDPVEICRYLGYPQGVTPAPRMAERIAQVVEQTRPHLRPRGAYAVYAVSSLTANSLNLNGTTITGRIGEFMTDSDRVAVFAVTVGEEISRLAEAAAKSGDALAACVMDATGSWAAEGAAEALMLRIRRHLKEQEELTLRYSPGYCGMEIDQQRNLFQLVQADSVGVTLMPSMLMHPLKSISGLVGFAPKATVNHSYSPCDICPRVGCHMRR